MLRSSRGVPAAVGLEAGFVGLACSLLVLGRAGIDSGAEVGADGDG